MESCISGNKKVRGGEKISVMDLFVIFGLPEPESLNVGN